MIVMMMLITMMMVDIDGWQWFICPIHQRTRDGNHLNQKHGALWGNNWNGKFCGPKLIPKLAPACKPWGLGTQPNAWWSIRFLDSVVSICCNHLSSMLTDSPPLSPKWPVNGTSWITMGYDLPMNAIGIVYETRSLLQIWGETQKHNLIITSSLCGMLQPPGRLL